MTVKQGSPPWAVTAHQIRRRGTGDSNALLPTATAVPGLRPLHPSANANEVPATTEAPTNGPGVVAGNLDTYHRHRADRAPGRHRSRQRQQKHTQARRCGGDGDRAGNQRRQPGIDSDRSIHSDSTCATPTPPPGPASSFADGVFLVGTDIAAGGYKTDGQGDGSFNLIGCYYAVLNSSNTSDIANNTIVKGPLDSPPLRASTSKPSVAASGPRPDVRWVGKQPWVFVAVIHAPQRPLGDAPDAHRQTGSDS